MGNDQSRPLPSIENTNHASSGPDNRSNNVRKRLSRMDLQRKVKSRSSQQFKDTSIQQQQQREKQPSPSQHDPPRNRSSSCSTPSPSSSSPDPAPASSPNTMSPLNDVSALKSQIQPKPSQVIRTPSSSEFTTRRQQHQRAVSTFSSHTTDSNWTMSGGLFSQIDPASSSTITAITDYSTISKHSTYYQDWTSCDRHLVRSAAEAMAAARPTSSSQGHTSSGDQSSCATNLGTNITSPPPYSSAAQAEAPTTSSLSSSPPPTSVDLQQEWFPLLDQLANIAAQASKPVLSKPSMDLTTHLLNQAFAMASLVKQDQDRQRLFHITESLCEQSITARTWLARCYMDAWGTPADPQKGFSSLLHLAESGCWEAFYPLANCYADGVPKLMDEPRSASTIGSNDSNSIASSSDASTSIVQPVNKQEAWRWLHMAAQLDDTGSSAKKQTKARAQYKIGSVFFDGDALIPSDHDKALHWFMQSANNGDKYAQFIVGFHFEQGILVEKNLALAKKHYNASADQGSPDAQAALGIVLIDDQQYQAGMKWLYDATQQKNTRAMVKLGTLFEDGQGVAKNEQEALKYYKMACARNDPGAHYVLGLHYRLGSLGLTQNFLEAGRHFNRAARAGFAPAQRLLGLMYLQGFLSGQPHEDNEQIRRKAEKTALLWFRRSAAQGDVRALGLVGACYQYGNGIGANYEVALEYYRKAARLVTPFQGVAQIAMAQLLHHMSRHRDAVEWFTKASESPSSAPSTNNDPSAMPFIGRMASPSRIARLMLARYHLHGWPGVTKDRAKGFAMLTTLAKESNQDAHAHYWLGACYEEGIETVCPCDHGIAYTYYLKAAEIGDTDAEFQVAFMLSNGKGVQRDRAAAFEWYKKAGQKNHKTALYSLGLYYAKGLDGVAKDLYQARICFEKAARLGVAEAMTSYATLCRIASLQPGPQQQEQREATLYWYKKAVAAGDITALRELGLLYDTGHGIPRDHETAFHYFELAAGHQDPQSTLLLGHYYQQGLTVEKDSNKALALYLEAENLGAHIAPFAAAQVYHSLNKFQEAYAKYLKASKSPRLANNRIGRTSKLMVARYILSYIPSSDQSEPMTFDLSKQDAFEIISKLASDEHFELAYCWLAECYEQGNGVDKDIKQAIHWYHKAADGLKDKDAMVKLASLYTLQTALPNHTTMAFHYYQLAADMGNAEAQHQLGMIYWRGGLNESINLGEAVCWFTRSAAQKYAASHWALGKMAQENGDQDVAIAWWRKSVTLGYEPAKRDMARLFLQNTQHADDAQTAANSNEAAENDGDNASIQMGNEDLNRAMDLLTEAVANGDAESLAFLGQLHQEKAASTSYTSLDGSVSALPPVNPANNHSRANSTMDDDDNLSQDHDMDDEDTVAAEQRLQQQQQEQGLATRCFEQAAEMGHVESMFLAGESWHSQQQYAAALEYYQRAAEHGHLLARVMCARYHLEGHGRRDPDPERGYQELYACAMEHECVDAYNSLGQCNEMGLGASQNYELALEWYTKSAQQTEDAEAMFRIGHLYAQQLVAPPQDQHHDLAALEWYHCAINTRQHSLAHYQTGLYLLHGIYADHDGCLVTLLAADRQQARLHFHHAAEQGDANAMFELGQLLLMQDEEDDTMALEASSPHSPVTPSPAPPALDTGMQHIDEQRQGLEWLERSSRFDHRDSLRELGKLYHSGKAVQDEVLVAKDMAVAFDYFSRSAHMGDKTSMLFIGIYYEHGFHVSLDLAMARQWYEMASRSGWWLAELAMAQLLHQDMDQREEAYRYFVLAHDHAPSSQRQTASIMIARYQLRGWGGVPIQLESAAQQLIVLAEQDHQVKVYLEVAQCYEFGIGTQQDRDKAFLWYQRVVHHHQQAAADLDEEDQEDLAEALFRIAEFYRQGWSVPMDQAQALRLYNMAAQQGSHDAQDYLQTYQVSTSSSS